MNRLIRHCVLALSASAILSTNVLAADAASCQNVRMGVVNWTDVIATSAMAQVLLDGAPPAARQAAAHHALHRRHGLRSKAQCWDLFALSRHLEARFKQIRVEVADRVEHIDAVVVLRNRSQRRIDLCIVETTNAHRMANCSSHLSIFFKASTGDSDGEIGRAEDGIDVKHVG